MSVVERDNVALYYEDSHPGARDAPTIFLSHGYGATSAMWKQQARFLSSDDRVIPWRVITWDMRGHGQSDSPDDPTLYSESHTVNDMNFILEYCDVREAVVGGLSLGGYMSLAFNLTNSGKVKALTLFDTGPGYKNGQARQSWNDMAATRASALETKGLDALGASSEVRVSQHKSAQGLAHAARGMLAQVDDRVILSLPSIDVPTLVLVGDKDTPFLAPTDYMVNKIRGAVKVVIAEAGHASNLDQPTAFNQEVADFLDRL